MARVGIAPSLCILLFTFSSFLFVSEIHGHSLLERAPIQAEGLSYDYYSKSCPSLETIVSNYLQRIFAEESVIGPGILRLFFHDCFTSGCDASLILHRHAGEILAPDHQGFRPYVLDTIENLRAIIRLYCPRVVSCSDIITLAAREAIRQYGGPEFDVPLGRRDSLTFNRSSVINLPSGDHKVGKQLEYYKRWNLDVTELVALSGAHTYGVANCGALKNRTKLGLPIHPEVYQTIMTKCKNLTSFGPYVNLDQRTPFKFDNMFYVDLLNDQAVLNSDQDLAVDPRTKDLVKLFASDEKLFFEKFARAFVKISQLNVLTGTDGDIRKSCFASNKEESAENYVDEVELLQKI